MSKYLILFISLWMVSTPALCASSNDDFDLNDMDFNGDKENDEDFDFEIMAITSQTSQCIQEQNVEKIVAKFLKNYLNRAEIPQKEVYGSYIPADFDRFQLANRNAFVRTPVKDLCKYLKKKAQSPSPAPSKPDQAQSKTCYH